MRKTEVSITMMILVLAGMIVLTFNVHPVKTRGNIGVQGDRTLADSSTALGGPELPMATGLVPVLDSFTVVMENGTTDWDTGSIGGPYVVYDSGMYKMWYCACSQSWPGRRVIAYAESSDGITWSNKQVIHGPSDASYNNTGSPWVLKEGGTYRMWHRDYYEWIAGDWSTYITHMTSSDGVSWPVFMSASDIKVMSAQGQSDPQGDGYCVYAPCVLYELGTGYTMWYSVNDHPQPGKGGPSKIWRATSTDGITWTNRQLSLPYVPNTWEENVGLASVVKEDDGTYTMFYNAWFTNGTGKAIGMAKSTDGIIWTERQQLLKTSDLGINAQFYCYGLVHFKDVDGKRYLYFSYYDEGEARYKFGRIQLDPLSASGPGNNSWASAANDMFFER